jgi:hypothetical protein
VVWLNALLAFSLAMIVCCTIGSAVTAAMQRIFHMRPAGLRRMIEQLFGEYIWPRLRDTLGPRGACSASDPGRSLS